MHRHRPQLRGDPALLLAVPTTAALIGSLMTLAAQGAFGFLLKGFLDGPQDPASQQIPELETQRGMTGDSDLEERFSDMTYTFLHGPSGLWFCPLGGYASSILHNSRDGSYEGAYRRLG